MRGLGLFLGFLRRRTTAAPAPPPTGPLTIYGEAWTIYGETVTIYGV